MPGAVAPVAAAAAYRATQSPATAAAEDGFGATMARAVEGAVELGRSADAASTQALLGQGSVSDVVLAVSRAELALQTAVAVRDRVVAAYQDVMRMPI
ncbi:flagellar hook-basal body complex protein FliE [Paeniroseomonas aquatica]|uniref:Flagellar hook-basal body complex protein FliE n=1 Tax=Paeniroseomonas aquatica TaxID=373043 RepID=A0ABT8ABY7_9PROT|nr:flagellar hook-basal body complex protein FliE [Paeniroseomonas aquatica]MDN3567337.1 flagellar hook-basal body complex protein FliE [Paeniroseomonas aquatica]